MEANIRAELDRTERDEGIKILYAVESGSRAWGFASTDSDWDVRFIYLQRPEWYLSVQSRPDFMQCLPSDLLDIAGWELRKTLRLFARCNPSLLEWLHSPIVYREGFSTAPELRRLSTEFFSAHSCMHHYLHMAAGNFRDYLRGERVRVKKYFYVLRPVLACRWIEAHGTMPPLEFDKLVQDRLPEELHPIVADLTSRKRAGEELHEGPRIPELHAFLEQEIARLGAYPELNPDPRIPDWDSLDRVFRASLDEAWKAG